MGNIYRLVELNAGHREQQRKLPIINQIYDILTELHNQGNSWHYIKSLHTQELKETKKQTKQQNK